MILYDHILSPNCYKVRLFASLVGVELTLRPVDIHPGRQNRMPEFLALNQAGTVPVLIDGDLVLTDSAAMLVLLSARHCVRWLGTGTPEGMAAVQQGLAFAERLNHSLGRARAQDMLMRPSGDLAALQLAGRNDLRALEQMLSAARIRGELFLAGSHPTIADIACFPQTALAPDGGTTLAPYPAIRLWMRALRSLPGFIEMPGIHRLHDLTPDPHPEPV